MVKNIKKRKKAPTKMYLLVLPFSEAMSFTGKQWKPPRNIPGSIFWLVYSPSINSECNVSKHDNIRTYNFQQNFPWEIIWRCITLT